MPPRSSRATSVGSGRRPSGSHHGVCVKWTVARSGRAARRREPDEGEVVVLHEHHCVRRARPQRWLPRTLRSRRGSASHASRQRRSIRGRRGRSYRPCRQNHNVALQMTSYDMRYIGFIECEQPHSQPLRLGNLAVRRRLAIAVGHRRGQPDRVRARDERCESRTRDRRRPVEPSACRSRRAGTTAGPGSTR